MKVDGLNPMRTLCMLFLYVCCCQPLCAAQQTDAKPKTPAANKNDPLERLIQSMRTVHQRIQDRDTGERTRKIQEQIVQDLDELIKQARRRQNSSQQQSRQPNPQQQSPPNQDNKQQSADDEAQAANSAANKQNNQDDARESSERIDEAQRKKVELARRRSLAQEIWGHLPPMLRSKVLNVFSAESLPEYRDLVRRYFESLDGRSSGRDPK